MYDTNENCLIKPLGWRHASLDDKTANILPALLEERNQVVDGQHDVAHEFLIGHTDIANGDTKAKNLLQLELDGGFHLGDLAGEILRVGDGSREFTSCYR